MAAWEPPGRIRPMASSPRNRGAAAWGEPRQNGWPRAVRRIVPTRPRRPPDQAVAYAFAGDEHTMTTEAAPRLAERGFGGLTRREVRVLRLVPLGQTNREIAVTVAVQAGIA